METNIRDRSKIIVGRGRDPTLMLLRKIDIRGVGTTTRRMEEVICVLLRNDDI
jgi:hypothetical protein